MARSRRLVLGLSAFYHESACCLLVDGELVASAAEERFSRRKHDPRLPVEAFRFCLEQAGASITDLAALAYYELPGAKLERQLWAQLEAGARASTAGRDAEPAATDFAWIDPGQAPAAIRERLGWEGPIATYPHHASHAASAFYYSPFPEAAVLTADGVGEWATSASGRGEGAELELWPGDAFPHSLGLFYATLTAFLGFRVNGGEYKVMGLAAYGAPRFADRLRRVVGEDAAGNLRLDLAYFDFLAGRRMFSPALAGLLEMKPRRPDEPLTGAHRDLAASAQLVLEEILVARGRRLARRTGSRRLVMAGGVALNGVAVGRLRRVFPEIWVQPAAGDAGGSLGAAALAHRELTGERVAPLGHAFYGPRWDGDEVATLLGAAGIGFTDYRAAEGALLAAVAERLAAGEVVAWFQGALEVGPRALGGRSLLADPRNAALAERLNREIKRREPFRPFAPSVLAERAGEHFDLGAGSSPFMTEVCRVTTPDLLPAVTHVDGSARPQTVDPETAPRFAALLAAFARRTGCPVLLNTSFNRRGEPIVCSPGDALACFATCGADFLVLEDCVVERCGLPAGLAELLGPWQAPAASSFRRRSSALDEQLYTFV